MSRCPASGSVNRSALGNQRWSRCRRLLQDRLAAQTERIRTHLRDDLRPGLTVSEAGQRYCALASPDLYHLLVSELGWTPERHRRWLTQLLGAELLGPGAALTEQHRS